MGFQLKLLGSWVFLLLITLSSCHGKNLTVNKVIGIIHCPNCIRHQFSSSHASTGINVLIHCKSGDTATKTQGNGKVDNNGKFSVTLSSEITKNGSSCFAKLQSASSIRAPCPIKNAQTASLKLITTTEDNATLATTPHNNKPIIIKFSPLTCQSAFFWHLPNFTSFPTWPFSPPSQPLPPLQPPPPPASTPPLPPLENPIPPPSPAENPTPPPSPASAPLLPPPFHQTPSPASTPILAPPFYPTPSPASTPILATPPPTSTPTLAPPFYQTPSPTSTPTLAPPFYQTPSPTSTPTLAPPFYQTPTPTSTPILAPPFHQTQSPASAPILAPPFHQTPPPTTTPIFPPIHKTPNLPRIPKLLAPPTPFAQNPNPSPTIGIPNPPNQRKPNSIPRAPPVPQLPPIPTAPRKYFNPPKSIPKPPKFL